MSSHPCPWTGRVVPATCVKQGCCLWRTRGTFRRPERGGCPRRLLHSKAAEGASCGYRATRRLSLRRALDLRRVEKGRPNPAGLVFNMRHSGITPPSGESGNSRSRSTPDNSHEGFGSTVPAAQAIARLRTRSSPARSSSTEQADGRSQVAARHVPTLEVLAPRMPRETMHLDDRANQEGWTQGRSVPTIPEATFIAGGCGSAGVPSVWRGGPGCRAGSG